MPANILLITTDHGDMLGDHGLWHKTAAYESAAGIPMLFRRPGQASEGPSDRLVSLIDLAPTCLDLAGVPIPATYPGRSLLARSAEHGTAGRDGVFIECGYFPSTLTAIRTARWKYVHHMNGGFEELYDLDNDPHELYNLTGNEMWRRTQGALRAALIDCVSREGAPWYLEHGDLRHIAYNPRYNYYTGQRLPCPETDGS